MTDVDCSDFSGVSSPWPDARGIAPISLSLFAISANISTCHVEQPLDFRNASVHDSIVTAKQLARRFSKECSGCGIFEKTVRLVG
jgi:hypothetical protein